MTSEPTPDPAYARTPDSPNRNVQFGQEIGVDDTSPPEVAHGSRASDSELVEDSYIGEHARFVKPLDHRPPPQEASEASEFGQPEGGPPVADVGLPVEEPSVWDASKAGEAD
jgi:hypothetical protein